MVSMHSWHFGKKLEHYLTFISIIGNTYEGSQEEVQFLSNMYYFRYQTERESLSPFHSVQTRVVKHSV